MARSKRKTPIGGMSPARSDKPFKVDEHRAERRTVRAVLAETLDPDAKVLHSQQYGDPAHGPKDGKTYFTPTAKDMRK